MHKIDIISLFVILLTLKSIASSIVTADTTTNASSTCSNISKYNISQISPNYKLNTTMAIISTNTIKDTKAVKNVQNVKQQNLQFHNKEQMFIVALMLWILAFMVIYG